jgi:hypothetical protein
LNGWRASRRSLRGRALDNGLAATLLLGVLGGVTAPAGLPYLTESAFPVYWLHQSAIVLIGYPVVHLQLGIASKYALLLVASMSATLALHHFVIRRFAITRLCVGMKVRLPNAPTRRLVRPAEAAGER